MAFEDHETQRIRGTSMSGSQSGFVANTSDYHTYFEPDTYTKESLP
ncbi:uncharacterized protein G2W53_017537 [Senna tora]|uniref:Uncharacterized protein n=1 Tax=Senna tora TaxID=362788 RepID=A0A834TQ62_9FABA|nr:uncharacterized protein G2W53_017537 [Senna tora]